MRTSRSTRRSRSIQHKTTNIFTYMTHKGAQGGGGAKAGPPPPLFNDLLADSTHPIFSTGTTPIKVQ